MSYYSDVDEARDDYYWVDNEYFDDYDIEGRDINGISKYYKEKRKSSNSSYSGGYKVTGFPTYTGKRKARLSNKIEEKKAFAEDAEIGDECKCPICGSIFIKKSYQNKFCSGTCRIKYHNKRKIYG